MKGFIKAFGPSVTIDGIVTDFVAVKGRNIFVIECDGLLFHRVGGKREEKIPGSDLIQDRIFKRGGYWLLHTINEDWLHLSDKKAWLKRKFEARKLNFPATSLEA